MSFLERATTFLVERVAPRLVLGKEPGDFPFRPDLERQARDELEARIRMGRPGPEEWERRPLHSSPRVAPSPPPSEARPPAVVRRSRPVDVLAVTITGLLPPSTPEPAPEDVLTDRPV